MPVGIGGGLSALMIRIGVQQQELSRGLSAARAKVRMFTDDTSKGIQKYSQSFRTAGIVTTAVGGAITLVFAKAIKSASAFQDQMADVATMVDDTGKFMGMFDKGIRDMARQFGESTQTLSKGLYDILSASIAAEDAMDVLTASAMAARAGLTDTGTAADAITTVLNAYQMSASRAGDVSDKLFAIVKRGKLTFGELAGSIGNAVSIAARAGLSFEEVGASLAAMTRVGIDAAEASTALRGIMQAFLKPTDDAKEAFNFFTEQMGVTGFALDTNTLKTKGLTEVVRLLTNATVEETAAMFPNIRGLKGILASMADVEGQARDLDLMYNSLGLTQTAFDKTSSTLNFKLGQLRESFKDLMIEAVRPLIPEVEKIIGWFEGLFDQLRLGQEYFPDLTKRMVKTTAKLGLLLTAIGPLILLLPTLAKSWDIVSAAMVKHNLIAGTVAAKLLLLQAAIKTVLLPLAAYVAIILAGKKYIEMVDEAREAKTEEIKAVELFNMSIKKEIGLMKLGFEGAKKYRTLDIKTIKDKEAALKEINKAIVGLRLAQQKASDENVKENIAKEIIILEKKRELLKFIQKLVNQYKKETTKLTGEEAKKAREINEKLYADLIRLEFGDFEHKKAMAEKEFDEIISKKGVDRIAAQKWLNQQLNTLEEENTFVMIELQRKAEATKTTLDKVWDGFITNIKTAKQVAEGFGQDLNEMFTTVIGNLTSEVVSFFTGWQTQREEQLESLKESMIEEVESWQETMDNINEVRLNANQQYIDDSIAALDEYFDFRELKAMDEAELEETLNKKIADLEAVNIQTLSEDEARAHVKSLQRLKNLRDARLKAINELDVRGEELRTEHNERMRDMRDKEIELNTVTGQLSSAFDLLKDAIVRAAAELIAMKIVKGILGGPAGLLFQHGGIVPGPVGEPVPIIAHGQERIFSRSEVASGLGKGTIEGKELGDTVIQMTNNFYGDINSDVDIETIGDKLGESANNKLKR